MTPAYLMPIDMHTYGLFRHIEIEDPVTKKREKHGERIGPIWVMRPAEKGEKVDFITSLPDGTVLQLTKISEQRDDSTAADRIMGLIKP